jgi:CheY-like chemotaxis protein
MNPEVLRQIFDPFFTTKETGRGTGMGLATVYGIVQQHDGWIEVSSAPDDGTTFRIHLPLCAPPAVEVIDADPLLPLASTLAAIDGCTVLLAEDDADVRALARYVLEEANLHVIEAANGPLALALWEKHRGEIDLLLTDMVMPGGMTGADLADRILIEEPELPVIFSSGYSVTLFNDDRRFRKGLNYLPKPYLSSELIALVAKTLAAKVTSAPVQTEAA